MKSVNLNETSPMILYFQLCLALVLSLSRQELNLMKVVIFLDEYNKVGERKRCWHIQGNDYKEKTEIWVKSKVRK